MSEITQAERTLLASPRGRELLARIDAATCETVSWGVDRSAHVEHVALTVMRAKGMA